MQQFEGQRFQVRNGVDYQHRERLKVRSHSMAYDRSDSRMNACNNMADTSSSSGSSSYAIIQQLPEFPSFKDFAYQSTSIPTDRFHTLITMYRAHSQRVLDSVNKFNFGEIPYLFTHFWQELPPHINNYLGQNSVVTLIGICDSILYRTILRAVLPTPSQVLPDTVLKLIRRFADDILTSLQHSLKNATDNLVYVKLKRESQEIIPLASLDPLCA